MKGVKDMPSIIYMSDTYKTVIREIKREMCEQNISIRRLADAIQCDAGQFGEYLRYIYRMNGDVMLRAMQYLNMDVNAVLFGKMTGGRQKMTDKSPKSMIQSKA